MNKINFLFKKVVTHSGTFHADEILACATIRYFTGSAQKQDIIRTFEVAEYLTDPEVCVLDIGRHYDPGTGNFDHHQDVNLAATNVLILRYLLPEGRLRDLMEEYLYSYVSECDKGGENLPGVPTLPSLIRGLNNAQNEFNTGFESAYDLAYAAVMSAHATAEKRIESETRWADVEKVGKVAITDSTEHIVGWHELAETDGILMLITPNQRGGYQITSRSTDVFVIPECDLQIFRHNSGFLAAYATKGDAVNHAMSL